MEIKLMRNNVFLYLKFEKSRKRHAKAMIVTHAGPNIYINHLSKVHCNNMIN